MAVGGYTIGLRAVCIFIVVDCMYSFVTSEWKLCCKLLRVGIPIFIYIYIYNFIIWMVGIIKHIISYREFVVFGSVSF